LLQRYARILAVMLVLALGASAWRHRNDAWVQALWRPEPAPRSVGLDNGSAREPAAPGKPVAGTSLPAPANLPGQMKKCVRGQQVTYTDQPCEPGARVGTVTSDKLSVVPGAVAPPTAPDAAPKGRSQLHDALDLNEPEKLRDKMMERAIHQ
jgi:hypothetical protein